MTKEKLVAYFTEGLVPVHVGGNIGMEVETQFVDQFGKPISLRQSQGILRSLHLREFNGWRISEQKGDLITSLKDRDGNRILYDLGWQNLELATVPRSREEIVVYARKCLEEIYDAAKYDGAYPFFGPVLPDESDLLVVPDQRDQIWVDLDGREALAPLARISSVQFTISAADPYQAIFSLNRLGRMVGHFLENYPQEHVWRKYVKNSCAGYDPLRYGGPLFFRDIEHYCEELLRHNYVAGPRLVPCAEVADFNSSQFIRSVWWYFRLKRYGSELCIEVRPLGRYRDEEFEEQLKMVLNIVLTGGRYGAGGLGTPEVRTEMPRFPKYPSADGSCEH